MARTLTRNHEHYRKALKRLPLGVASNFRFWGEDRTIYVKEGRGARVTDLDDNVYVDYRMGYGPAILGYADPRVDEAASAAWKWAACSRCPPSANTASPSASRRWCRRPSWCASPTPAPRRSWRRCGWRAPTPRRTTTSSSRAAITGCSMRPCGTRRWRSGRRSAIPQVVPYSEGVPLATRNFAHFVQANDANQLEDVLKRHGHSIACLLIEPIMGNCLGIAAEPAYVRAARELCDRHGVVLIIDEVKTGFRVARGGVQELYGVRADLCTFAKAVANGYPISVLAGREDIMRKLGKGVAHGGTYTAHPVSLAAAEKTLEILAETDALERIAGYGTRLRSGKSAILKARGIAHSFVGHPSMTGLYFARIRRAPTATGRAATTASTTRWPR